MAIEHEVSALSQEMRVTQALLREILSAQQDLTNRLMRIEQALAVPLRRS